MEFVHNIMSMMSSLTVWVGTMIILFAECFGRMAMFTKAGEAAYKAWIPFYRDYILCKITMGNGWFFLLGLFPPFYPILRILYAIEVTLSYGKGVGCAILYFFFPTAMHLYYGFGAVYYTGSRNLIQQVKNMFSGFFGA